MKRLLSPSRVYDYTYCISLSGGPFRLHIGAFQYFGLQPPLQSRHRRSSSPSRRISRLSEDCPNRGPVDGARRWRSAQSSGQLGIAISIIVECHQRRPIAPRSHARRQCGAYCRWAAVRSYRNVQVLMLSCATSFGAPFTAIFHGTEHCKVSQITGVAEEQ